MPPNTRDHKMLRVSRYYSKSSPGEGSGSSAWQKRDVRILDENGKSIFARDGVEAPASWSDNAVAIAAYLYFSQSLRENSIAELIRRVTRTVTSWGLNGKYFSD